MQAVISGGMGGFIAIADQSIDIDEPVVDQTEENDKDFFLSQSQRRIHKDTFLFANAEIQTSDPSKFFEIKHEHQLGEGGFAKVFKVKRRKDGLVCALKFCEPRKEADRNLVINEIGLMNQCQGQDTVLKIYSSHDFKDRIWIFLEIMDCDLT